MRGFLLILIFTFIAPLQCYDNHYDRSNFYFVTRRDTNEAICITPNVRNFFSIPTFDLDKLQIPRDDGFKYWDWLADWQLQNDTDVRLTGRHKVLIAGNQPFHLVAQKYGRADVYILASNVSLWMADINRARGAGMLFELDHSNETTKLKDTTLKYCDKNPQRKKAKCTIVDYKNGTNLLNDGNHWTEFVIKLAANPTGVEMFETSYRKQKLVVQWNNTNISDPLQFHRFKVFGKSHQRNAAFYNEEYRPDLSNNKEMNRNYTKRSSGKLCVKVWWNEDASNDSNELLEVKNLASGRVQPPTNATQDEWSTMFHWNHLYAGEYEITLRFDKRKPKEIDLCPDHDSKIKSWTWVSIPKAITKCQIYVGYSDFTPKFSAGPSSPPDPTLQPDWTLEEWAYVCDRLGIGPNDTEVQIKFCNFKGCNFSKCPHLQGKPSNIFDC